MLDTSLPTITLYQSLIGLLSILSPNILAFISRPTWKPWMKVILWVIYHLGIAFLFLGEADMLDWGNLFLTSQLLLTYAIASYSSFWKPFSDRIEVMTSPRPKHIRENGRVPLRAIKSNGYGSVFNNMYTEEY